MYSLGVLNSFAWIIKSIGLYILSGSILYDMRIPGNVKECWVPVTGWQCLDSFGFLFAPYKMSTHFLCLYFSLQNSALPIGCSRCYSLARVPINIIPISSEHCCWLLSGQAREFSCNFLFMWRYFIHTVFISFLLNYSFNNAMLFFSSLRMALPFFPHLFEVFESSKAFLLYLW